jgi:hypothetical protein
MRTAIFIILFTGAAHICTGTAAHSASVEIKHGFVLMNASVNGQAGYYILDSGAPGLVVNTKHHRTESSEQYAMYGVDGNVELSQLKTWAFQWNSFSLQGQDAFAIDLSYLEILLERNIDGLVGMELFEGYDILIDYASGTLELWNVLPAALQTTPWIEFPLTYEDHIPVITLRRGKKQLKFGIDTGAGSNLIGQNTFKSLRHDALVVETINLVGANRKHIPSQAVEIDGLSAGNVTFPKIHFVVMDFSQINRSTGMDFDGILGQPFLAGRLVLIDRDRETLRISPVQEVNSLLVSQ